MPPRLTCVLLACGLLSACTPEPPEKERRPEPQAMQARPASGSTVPADPIERARAVQDQLDEADQRQRDAIEDAGG